MEPIGGYREEPEGKNSSYSLASSKDNFHEDNEYELPPSFREDYENENEHMMNEYKEDKAQNRNSRSAPDLLDLEYSPSRFDSLRHAQSDDKGIYDEYYGSHHRTASPVYDEPSDMNYGDSDFHHTGTYTNSDDKFNVAYEKGLDADTLAKSSRFNTNSENYQIYESSQGYQQFEPKSAADATMPPPVQLTKRFQEPINYDSTLEMPSPPSSPLKQYNYSNQNGGTPFNETSNFPHIRFYQNKRFEYSRYSTEQKSKKTMETDSTEKSRNNSIGFQGGLQELPLAKYSNGRQIPPTEDSFDSSKWHRHQNQFNLSNAGMGINGRRRTTNYAPQSNELAHRLSGRVRRQATMTSSTFSEPQLESLLAGLNSSEAESLTRTSALIQHISFRDSTAKNSLRKLGAISKLVTLLDNPLPEVQRAAIKAIKNIIFTNEPAKLDMRRCGGLDAVVRILKTTPDPGLRSLSSAVIWNLSSCDSLKQTLIHEAIQILAKLSVRSEPLVFTNATGSLRNLSSAGAAVRKKLRSFRGFISAILEVIHDATTCTEKANSKSTENAVCILRNLSYRLGAEVPDLANEHDETLSTDSELFDCFGRLKKKSHLLHNSPNDIMNKGLRLNTKPTEMDSLYQPSLIRTYLQLMMETTNSDTLEGLAGAIQNLTAGQWRFAASLRETVRAEKGLPVIVDLLKYEHDGVSVAACGALRNLALDPRNCSMLGEYAMEDIANKLPLPGETPVTPGPAAIYSICAVLLQLVHSDRLNAQKLSEHGGIEPLVSISRSVRYPPSCSKAAATVLGAMWKHRSLRTCYRKDGWSASHFAPRTEKQPLSLSEHPRTWLMRSIRSISSSRRSSMLDLETTRNATSSSRAMLRLNRSESGYRYSYTNSRKLLDPPSDATFLTTSDRNDGSKLDTQNYRSADSWV
ncbi:Oidioi.mRNA.OKI2018_I69.XSR.g16050.t1.cds [Oikopleura dioica]|uniref:Oidioi.mRNA.OKI2018_I69.XSR.g16050.t1.cds n=1 Tax=Oikopleura dioica TaxID=34765 RepID=A0ABN7SIR2_OIKDI|nr:Oidioi.mRNA.OKI2018_I69.XSR.g16050.t1.cds [Oikopleura dioica]